LKSTMTLGWAHLLLSAVAAQRALELLHARRNAAALMARGGREAGRRHYPLMILLHGGWLVCLALATAPDPPVRWAWLILFLTLQVLRLWVVASLGPYWTTRIVTLDDQPLQRRGPYRFMRHPNYAIVALEIPVLPLALGLTGLAGLFGLLNLLLLVHRIRVEEKALAPRRSFSSPAANRGR
jgi:methyltransferase